VTGIRFGDTVCPAFMERRHLDHASILLALCVGSVALGVSQASSPAVETARLAVPGGEIVYDTTGSGPPVVLLHGAFMDRRTWVHQFPAFARQFRVVRYDIRPFGESSRPEKAYSVPDDLLRLLDHLKIEKAHLVGHSFGGGVALDFALLHPNRVASLVLAASPPSGFVGPEEERKAAMAVFAAVKDGDDAIVKAWLAHPIWNVSRTRPEVLTVLDAITRRNLAPFRMAFAPYVPLTPPAVERLNDVKAPTLVIVGDADTPGNRQASDLLAKRIPGASIRVVEGADHGLPLGWADQFNAAVIAFISANSARLPSLIPDS
jgi:3-oxoadipate enol-lactonase